MGDGKNGGQIQEVNKIVEEEVKAVEEVTKLDLTKVLGTFLKEKGGIETLRKALSKHGLLLFKESEFIKQLAETRLVPGNEARQILDKIKIVMGYGEKT